MDEEVQPEISDDVTSKDKEIIDFISDREIFYENEAKSKIIEELKSKYGEAGAAMYTELNNDSHDFEVVDDCPECSKQAEEWIKQSQVSLKIIEDCLDESLTDVANNIIDSCDGARISRQDIIDGIIRITGKLERNIKDRYIEQICRKIIFIGMLDGWLVDEYFTDMQTAKENEDCESTGVIDSEEDN